VGQARKNNGKVRAQACGFCGIAATQGDSLLDDLQFYAESTTYAERKKNAAISGESTAYKIQFWKESSLKIYLDGKALSRPLGTFCSLDGP
jgi:hypothetical protein